VYKVDIPRVILELHDAGRNYSRQAEWCDVDCRTVRDWKTELHQPMFYPGCALCEFYLIVVHKDLPRKN
jgi:hypothetical protein